MPAVCELIDANSSDSLMTSVVFGNISFNKITCNQVIQNYILLSIIHLTCQSDKLRHWKKI